jgi:FKBP12-rapamycin complex-associated protein
MLVKAMEVSGVEGSYRDTCERTMTVLRDNRDSLVAMLEAFVYDPLISWRLLGESPNIEGDDLELKESITPRELARQEEVIDSPINNLGQLVSHILVKDPIHEDSTEEDQTNDSSDRATTANEKQRLPVKPLSETFSERKKPMFSKSQVTGSLHSSHLRSLKMYSDIQNLASNLNVSSRIASITGDGTVRNFAAESVSRSRLDRSFRQKEAFSIAGQHDGNATEDALNEKALKVIRRVQDKLSGTDFHPSTEGIDPLDVQDQVQKLIVQATSTENLCQLFIGWCAFW